MLISVTHKFCKIELSYFAMSSNCRTTVLRKKAKYSECHLLALEAQHCVLFNYLSLFFREEIHPLIQNKMQLSTLFIFIKIVAALSTGTVTIFDKKK